jgi:hypothetical protein
MAVSRRLRFEILRRDGNRCRYCGGTAPDVKLTVDHVIPTALGGSDDPSNLVACCADCNGGKSASSPDAAVVEDVKQGAIRWAAALRRAAEERDREAEGNAAILDGFRSKWTTWFSYPSCYATGDECPVDQRTPMTLDDSWGWKRTLTRWYASGAIDGQFVVEAIRIAMKKPGLDCESTWRYFCGVVWNEIKERQALAAKYMVEDEPAGTPTTEFPVDSVACGLLAEIMQALGASADVADLADEAMSCGLEYRPQAPGNGREADYRPEDWFPESATPWKRRHQLRQYLHRAGPARIGQLRQARR